MRKPLSLVTGIAVVAALALAGVARADTTLGTTDIPAGADPGACDGDVIAQATSDPAAPYTVPGPGTINRFQVYAGSPSVPGSSLTFVVLKAAGSGFTVVGTSTQNLPNPFPPSRLASYSIAPPIAVTGGETLGLWDAGSNVVCYLSGGSTPSANTLMDLPSAAVPSPGQTLAVHPPNSPPGYRMLLTANFVPTPPAAKKKCKKHKRKRSAEAAKKKCKKKKRG
jgi:hypothetical protein